jgi:hypothetical protein
MSVYKNDKLNELKESLESLYNQTKKADIFIQQDGKLPKELESFLDNELKGRKIVYLGKRDKNLGLAFSLNELLDVVKEKYTYIVRMDADDISVDDRIEKQVDFLGKNIDIKAVGSWIEEFNIDTNKRQIIRYGEFHEELKRNLLKRNPLAHVTICFRNTFFDIISSYDTEKLNEDFDLWIRAFKKDVKLHSLQEVLVRVRTSNDFFARRKNIKRAKEVMYLKFDATKSFGFGIRGYIYAVAHFLLFLSPSIVKRYLYKKMRN